MFIWDALGLDGWGVFFFLIAIGDFLCTLGYFIIGRLWVHLGSGISLSLSLFSLSNVVLVSWRTWTSLTCPSMH